MDYQEFKRQAGELVGIDLNEYKSQQMDRRIHSLMQSWAVQDYNHYLRLLKTNPQRYKEFVKKLTINVSEFFRNPERFEELWRRVLPELLDKNSKIRIWSAGCSNGAEPYSVALLAQELGVTDRVQIIGTDIDQVVLTKAREGVYEYNDIKNLPSHFLGKYFKTQNHRYYLNNDVKSMVEFLSHNLLKDPFLINFDLIICRNVVIYFKEEAKKVLYHKFFESLNPGGYLLVGGTEPLLNYRSIGFINSSISFYQKPFTNSNTL